VKPGAARAAREAAAGTGSARSARVGRATLVSLSMAFACASYSDALERGQRYYEDNQYERALALWRDLDRRGADFSAGERARYAYFRGMTDYRLGYRDDARHWLAIARAADSAHPGSLGSVWLERLDSALMDLGRTPSRSGRGAADVVQTIEAPPGATAPDEPGAARDDSVAEAPAEPALGVPAPGADAGAAPSPGMQP
jgi:hypothetical protein